MNKNKIKKTKVDFKYAPHKKAIINYTSAKPHIKRQHITRSTCIAKF